MARQRIQSFLVADEDLCQRRGQHARKDREYKAGRAHEARAHLQHVLELRVVLCAVVEADDGRAADRIADIDGNKDKLDMMKDGVVILNFARDTLVNDDDMAAALEAGKVARYVSDFPNPKVVHMKNVILTPHLGASTRESEDNCAVMAVKEITDYLENGNIKNSVNYPACDMGVCQAESRIAVLHMNIPNMIGQITAILAAQGVNISDMTNKSRDKFAYTLLDLEHKPEEATVEKLKAIDGVLRVRIVK